MRLHIALDDNLVAELDRRAGARRRSAYIAQAIRRALEDERRWDDIEAALGTISDTGHEWDEGPGAGFGVSVVKIRAEPGDSNAPSLAAATASRPGYIWKIVLNSTGGVTASCS